MTLNTSTKKHPFWLLPVLEGKANLVLTPCPGTKEVSLAESLVQLKEQGAKAVVTAMTSAELEKNNVADIGKQCEALGLRWFHQAIEDDNVPQEEFLQAWPETSRQLHQLLAQDGSVVLHCKGGSGRTGLLAAHLLLELGTPLSEAQDAIQALRPNAFTVPKHCDYMAAVAQKI